MELTKNWRDDKKNGDGTSIFPGIDEKGGLSGLFFFCLLSIRRYFTFDGGNVQFILSLYTGRVKNHSLRFNLAGFSGESVSLKGYEGFILPTLAFFGISNTARL